MDKQISIDKLQKEINILSKRVSRLEVNIKTNNTKKVKDPNAPKRPVTSFMLFNKHKLDEFKKKNPGQKISVTLISKQSGQEWKNLKDDEKDKYIKIANKEKKRYEKELALYNKNKEQ
jgi:hypothetical protein